MPGTGLRLVCILNGRHDRIGHAHRLAGKSIALKEIKGCRQTWYPGSASYAGAFQRRHRGGEADGIGQTASPEDAEKISSVKDITSARCVDCIYGKCRNCDDVSVSEGYASPFAEGNCDHRRFQRLCGGEKALRLAVPTQVKGELLRRHQIVAQSGEIQHARTDPSGIEHDGYIALPGLSGGEHRNLRHQSVQKEKIAAFQKVGREFAGEKRIP